MFHDFSFIDSKKNDTSEKFIHIKMFAQVKCLHLQIIAKLKFGSFYLKL